MQSKLGIDFLKVQYARNLSKNIADEVQAFINNYTTVAVERTLCRLIGIDGVDANAIVPLPNVVVDEIVNKQTLENGALYYLANAMIETGKSPQEIAENMAVGILDITRFSFSYGRRCYKCFTYINNNIQKISSNKQKREQYLLSLGEGSKPYLYVIVATGNIL